MDPLIPPLLHFWFSPSTGGPTRWFAPSPTFDAAIASSFLPLIKRARDTATLDGWTQHPQGTLALLLVLDQFPRNVFRGTREAYASDAKALEIATVGVAKGQDREVELSRRMFFYLPFMHNETLLAQVACVALYEALLAEAVVDGEEEVVEGAKRGVEMAERHRDVVGRFGRFPSRNGVLGRESTGEEEGFLGERPGGF
ncbi:hypothetical protein ACLMJK_008230 [Lecanora helva]